MLFHLNVFFIYFILWNNTVFATQQNSPKNSSLFIQGLKKIFSSVEALTFFVLILFIVVFVGILIVHSILKKKREGQPEELIHETPPRLGMLSEYLVRKGHIKLGKIGSSFMKGLFYIKQKFSFSHAIYQQPWFLILGPENAGKSSLFSQSNLLPENDIPEELKNPEAPIKWWFLDRMICLEPQGNLIVDCLGQDMNRLSMVYLSKLLRRYRGARPLNGIILTLPISDFYELDDAILERKYAHLSKKINDIFSFIALDLPVYILVTKCDKVPGFTSFFRNFNKNIQDELIGFSNPDISKKAPSLHFLHQGFEALFQQLSYLRLNTAVQQSTSNASQHAFLFYRNFETVCKKIPVMIHKLFHDQAFSENIIFRGLYISGDMTIHNDIPADVILGPSHTYDAAAMQGTDDDSAKNSQNVQSSPYASPNAMPEKVENTKDNVLRKIRFVKDLFNQKCMNEAGLAVPSLAYWRRDKMIRGVEIFASFFLVIASYGIYNAYENFTHHRDKIKPVLQNLEMTLRESYINQSLLSGGKKSKAALSSKTLTLQIRQLVDVMYHVERSEFFSWFIPASWWGGLNNRFNQMLHAAFSEVLIKAVVHNLALKASEMLDLSELQKKKPSTFAQILHITGSQEFADWNSFVDSFSELVEHISLFQMLKKTGEPKFLRKIVHYSLGEDLPTEFWNAYQKHQSILYKDFDYPYEMTPLVALAQKKLGVLHLKILTQLFSQTHPVSVMNQIKSFLKSLSQHKALRYDQLRELRQISIDLKNSFHAIDVNGTTWIDENSAELKKMYSIFYKKISNSSLFGPHIADQLKAQFDKGLLTLQSSLKELNLQYQTYLHSKKEYLDRPMGLVRLTSDILSRLFDGVFAGELYPPQLIFTPPPGQMLTFDSEKLKSIITYQDAYNQYQAKDLNLVPLPFRAVFKHAANDLYISTTFKVLYESLKVIDYPQKNEIVHIFQTQPERLFSLNAADYSMLMDVAKIIQTGSDPSKFSEFLKIMDVHFNSLIKASEYLINNSPLLAALRQPLDWWQGDQNLVSKLLGLNDSKEMEKYVKDELINILNLVNRSIKPAILMRLQYLPQSIDRDKKNILWATLVKDVKDQEQNSPNNPFEKLEKFLTQEVNNWKADEVLDLVSVAELQKSSQTFSEEILKQFKKNIRSRAEIVKRNQAVKAHHTLMEYFNTHLKDKFPFADASQRDTQFASLGDLKEFYRLYDSFGGSAKNILNQVYQLGGKADKISKVYVALDQVKDLFASFLKSPHIEPMYTVQIDFRTQRALEKGGDMIVDWQFITAETSSINRKKGSGYLDWAFGESVEFKFIWADSKQRSVSPVADRSQTQLSVQGKKATFKFGGSWSLLYAIQKHRDYSIPQIHGTSIPLRFEVLTTDNKKAVLHNTVTLLEYKAGSKAKGQPIQLPYFPTMLDAMDPVIVQLKDHSVITQGKVKESKLPLYPDIPVVKKPILNLEPSNISASNDNIFADNPKQIKQDTPKPFTGFGEIEDKENIKPKKNQPKAEASPFAGFFPTQFNDNKSPQPNRFANQKERALQTLIEQGKKIAPF